MYRQCMKDLDQEIVANMQTYIKQLCQRAKFDEYKDFKIPKF